jgi:hypothetical protein
MNLSKGKFHHRNPEVLINLTLIIKPLCLCVSVVKEKKWSFETTT